MWSEFWTCIKSHSSDIYIITQLLWVTKKQYRRFSNTKQMSSPSDNSWLFSSTQFHHLIVLGSVDKAPQLQKWIEEMFHLESHSTAIQFILEEMNHQIPRSPLLQTLRCRRDKNCQRYLKKNLIHSTFKNEWKKHYFWYLNDHMILR